MILSSPLPLRQVSPLLLVRIPELFINKVDAQVQEGFMDNEQERQRVFEERLEQCRSEILLAKRVVQLEAQIAMPKQPPQIDSEQLTRHFRQLERRIEAMEKHPLTRSQVQLKQLLYIL